MSLIAETMLIPMANQSTYYNKAIINETARDSRYYTLTMHVKAYFFFKVFDWRNIKKY